MSDRKLVRAEIPMCPECGTECERCQGGELFRCPECRCHWMKKKIHYGHYPPDVSGVIADLLEAGDALVEGDWHCRLRDLQEWADRLEGKP